MFESDADKYVVVLRGVLLKEAGVYRVEATNEIGSLTASAKLTVNGKR